MHYDESKKIPLDYVLHYTWRNIYQIKSTDEQ